MSVTIYLEFQCFIGFTKGGCTRLNLSVNQFLITKHEVEQ